MENKHKALRMNYEGKLADYYAQDRIDKVMSVLRALHTLENLEMLERPLDQITKDADFELVRREVYDPGGHGGELALLSGQVKGPIGQMYAEMQESR